MSIPAAVYPVYTSTFFVFAPSCQRWLYHWNSFVARRHVHSQMEVFVGSTENGFSKDDADTIDIQVAEA